MSEYNVNLYLRTKNSLVFDLDLNSGVSLTDMLVAQIEKEIGYDNFDIDLDVVTVSQETIVTSGDTDAKIAVPCSVTFFFDISVDYVGSDPADLWEAVEAADECYGYNLFDFVDTTDIIEQSITAEAIE